MIKLIQTVNQDPQSGGSPRAGHTSQPTLTGCTCQGPDAPKSSRHSALVSSPGPRKQDLLALQERPLPASPASIPDALSGSVKLTLALSPRGRRVPACEALYPPVTDDWYLNKRHHTIP